MDFIPGRKVKYFFPNPNSPENIYFIGTIDTVEESFITIINESNTLLRVSYKNYNYLEYYPQQLSTSFPKSENYYG